MSTSGRRQLQLREQHLFLTLSIITGILAGLVSVLFTLAIERIDRLLFGFAASPARLLLVPMLVSLATGTLLAWVFRDVRGSGIPQVKAAFHLQQGHIPLRVPFGKFLLGVLTVGSGHSLGREGPSVQIGAGIASAVGRAVNLPANRIKELVPVGAAGALAAAFNTPIAAVLFALEEIIGDMNATLIGSTVVASVAAVVVERSILGNEPLLHVPGYELVHPAELLAYSALGIVGGIVSLIFTKSLLGLRAAFMRLPRFTIPFQPAVGGALIGATLLVVPQIKGVGYEYVNQALNGDLVLRTLLVFGLMKLAATVISYSSGNAGGIFAPTLYLGAMVGGAVGTIVQRIAPFPHGAVGAYALVGMGTLFAGIIRAPITSVFMIFELTQDYQILVPLMLANLLSYSISRRYQHVPVYDALLRQDHVHLPEPGLRSGLFARTARDVMQRDTTLLSADLSVERASELGLADPHTAYLVGSRERLLGVVTRTQLTSALDDGRGEAPVRSLVGDHFVHVHPDQPLDVVIERLGESTGVLPVVSREDFRRMDGVIRPEDLAWIFKGSNGFGKDKEGSTS